MVILVFIIVIDFKMVSKRKVLGRSEGFFMEFEKLEELEKLGMMSVCITV